MAFRLPENVYLTQAASLVFPSQTPKSTRAPSGADDVSLCCVQIGTTKGTGGDVLILEEAAYYDEGFFYETVAPILSVGSAILVAISTLTSETISTRC
jgi:hypothetical protein